MTTEEYKRWRLTVNLDSMEAMIRSIRYWINDVTDSQVDDLDGVAAKLWDVQQFIACGPNSNHRESLAADQRMLESAKANAKVT